MKRIVLAALLGLFSCLAFADRVDDLKEQGHFCDAWALFAAKGAGAKMENADIPLSFHYPYQEGTYPALAEALEHGQVPKDGFYMLEQELTEQEKRFWEDATAEGWTHPNKSREQFRASCQNDHQA